MDFVFASIVMTSPSLICAMGPPTCASGVIWPIMKPCRATIRLQTIIYNTHNVRRGNSHGFRRRTGRRSTTRHLFPVQHPSPHSLGLLEISRRQQIQPQLSYFPIRLPTHLGHSGTTLWTFVSDYNYVPFANFLFLQCVQHIFFTIKHLSGS